MLVSWCRCCWCRTRLELWLGGRDQHGNGGAHGAFGGGDIGGPGCGDGVVEGGDVVRPRFFFVSLCLGFLYVGGGMARGVKFYSAAVGGFLVGDRKSVV